MENIAKLIIDLGFPVACVIGTFWFIVNKDKNVREDNIRREENAREDTAKREERMYGFMDRISDSLKDVSVTLEKTNERIDRLEETISGKGND